MSITYYQFDTRELEDELTKAAHALAEHLGNKGIIDEETAQRLYRSIVVVVRKPSMISRVWDQLFNRDKDDNALNILIAEVDTKTIDRTDYSEDEEVEETPENTDAVCP
jgi:hypothetical protein